MSGSGMLFIYTQDVPIGCHSLTDLQSLDGRFLASGHENGNVYIFSTATGRMPFSLSGMYSGFNPQWTRRQD